MNAASIRAAWVLSALIGSANAAPIVNAPIPFTHQMIVQPIIVRNDTGTVASTYFGNATQQAQIELYIDQIWAQAGIDVTFLAPNFYNNEFARVGSGAGTRPTGDLNTIVANAPIPPKSANPKVINLFFVEISPGFGPLNENTAAGLAFVGGNGSTVFVGDNLVSFEAGQIVVAGVVAHELGHNLGLNHTGSGLPNLMSPNGSSEQLDAGQIMTALGSSLLSPFVPVPEPSTIFGFGVVGLWLTGQFRRRRAA